MCEFVWKVCVKSWVCEFALKVCVWKVFVYEKFVCVGKVCVCEFVLKVCVCVCLCARVKSVWVCLFVLKVCVCILHDKCESENVWLYVWEKCVCEHVRYVCEFDNLFNECVWK